MNKLSIEICQASSKFFLWGNNDIESIKIYSLPVGLDDDNYATLLEEFIYENPDIIRSNAETQVLLSTARSAMIPDDINEESINRLFTAAWNQEELKDYVTICNHLDSNRKLKSVSTLPVATSRFLNRSFHPIRMNWVMDVFIEKWMDFLKGNVTSVFIERDGDNYYIGVFDNYELTYANVLHSPDNKIDFLLEGILTITQTRQNKTLFYIDYSQKGSNELADFVSKRGYNIEPMVFVTKSSFAAYVYDSHEISLPTKTFVCHDIK